MPAENLDIHPEWKAAIASFWDDTLMAQIRAGIMASRTKGHTVYPPSSLIFNAFNSTPLSELKVVILGQDPNHQPHQAMGLSFSVPQNVRIPASLRNIYKELIRDLNIATPGHGDLSIWSTQGVLLLNAILTVEGSNAGSHRKIGWQQFTDQVISYISEHKEGIVFLLWGNFAKSKKALIDTEKHHVLEAVHPSPLAGNKFIGCGHFSKTNELLTSQNQEPIDWSIP